MKKKVSLLLILCIICCNFVFPTFASQYEDDFLIIDRTSKHLGSRLHKEYEGYIYTITNKSGQDININSISFADNLTGKAAYASVKRSSAAIGLKTIGSGLVHAIPTLTLSLICGVVSAPVKMICNTCGNIGAKQDSNRYDKIVNSCVLKNNSKIELKTIAVKHNKPTINIIYNLENGNNEIKTIKY